MSSKNVKSVQSVAPDVVVSFLKETIPFNELDDQTLERIARHIIIDFYPAGTVLFKQDETEVEYLYLVQKGGMKIYLTDQDGVVTLKDFRGEGAYVGALPIIQETKANLNVETVEDTFCFLLPKDVFLNLVRDNSRIAQFFLKSFSEKFIRTAYRELRHRNMVPRTEGTLFLFSVTVNDLVKDAPKCISGSQSVQDAAALMAEFHIGSLLVKDEQGEIAGIVTDKDLRTKIVARGRSLATPVRDIMASPVETVPADAVCFDALLAMMKKQIHHLAVTRDGIIAGVVTAHDIMVLQGSSPLYLFREIVAQRHIEGLYPLSQKVPLVIRTLIEEGAKANNITRMITILNDYILEKILSLLVDEMGPPPVPFCWLLMGSEGRKEQTFRTDQDNAIVYQDPVDDAEKENAEDYFRLFGERAIDHLEKCGYPRCPGDIMASNPRWRMSLSGWKDYFSHLIAAPEPAEILHASIFFDFRPGYGEISMAEEMRRHIAALSERQQIYLLHMARDYMGLRVPLSFFKNFIVEKDGEHKNKLDIKHKGLVPIINFARILSLRHGIAETNTITRLKALAAAGHISDELCSMAVDAYELQMQMRFVHQLEQIERGEEPDNYIDPGRLSDLEKQMLKDTFGVIERLQGVLKSIFPAG
jgi:CBS domain-containing protein